LEDSLERIHGKNSSFGILFLYNSLNSLCHVQVCD
jgi:hypothetical protein